MLDKHFMPTSFRCGVGTSASYTKLIQTMIQTEDFTTGLAAVLDLLGWDRALLDHMTSHRSLATRVEKLRKMISKW